MKRLILSIATILIFKISSVAQIPNNGFENWTPVGSYEEPNGWGTLNSITAFDNVYTCTKYTPGNPGASYINVTSANVTGMGIMPGIAASGNLNFSNKSASGFAFSARPQDLTGYWQYMAFGSDKGYFEILLTKWNSILNTRDTIAYNHHKLPGMEMSWVSFAIPLVYLSGAFPDTASILISASGPTPVAGSYVFVDSLSFSGAVAGVYELKLETKIQVFPNPSNDKLSIHLSNASITNCSVELFDIQWKKIKSYNCADFSAPVSIDISDLNKGEYFLKLVTLQKEILNAKFTKQ